jgi:hypothetical protein
MDLVELMSPPPASVVELVAMFWGWVLVQLLSRLEGTGENAILEGMKTMSKYRFAYGRHDEGIAEDEILASDGREGVEASSDGRVRHAWSCGSSSVRRWSASWTPRFFSTNRPSGQ